MPESPYPTDALYPTRYFRELSPAWLNYVAHMHGAPAPALDRPFRYLELGCGTGLSGAAHAAAFPQAGFHLCDFNPRCVAAARRHARRFDAGNVTLTTRRFTELDPCALPAFDYIVLHGVYAWVGVAEQQAILTLLQHRLRPGGLAYVSYNCLPGWAAEMPLVHLSQRLASAAGGDSAQRVAHVIRVLEVLDGSGLRYFAESPGARSAVAAYRRADAGYLAHELLSGGWQPRYVTDVHQQMAGAGLRFIGSATLADNHPALLVDDTTQDLINALPTPELQALAMDFAVNRRFRRDVFVREAENPEDAGSAVTDNQTPVGTLSPELEPGVTALVPRGRLRFDDDFIGATGRLLGQRPWPLDELVTRLAGAGHDRHRVARNVHYALAAGLLTPFARSESPSSALPRSFNNAVTERCLREGARKAREGARKAREGARKAREGARKMREGARNADEVVWIPSPMVGGAVPVRNSDAVHLLRALRSPDRAADHKCLHHFRQLGLLR